MRTRAVRRHRTSAQAIVEFALISPLLFVLLLAVVEGGRLVYAYNTVNHAAQEAGRLGILSSTVDTNTVRTKAVDAADPLSINASSVTVDVNDGSTNFADRALGDRLKVTVTYTFVPVTTMVFGSDAGIVLVGETELMVE